MLSSANAARFDDEVLDDLRASFPGMVEERGEEPTRTLIRDARERARAHGFDEASHVAQYIGLAFVLGVGFDTDGALPWAARILDDPTPAGPSVRIARLMTRATDHLSGAEGSHAS